MPRTSRTTDRLIIISMLMMAFAVINLYWYSTAPARHSIHQEYGSSTQFTRTLPVRADHSYRVHLRVEDSSFDEGAVVSATLRVFVDSELFDTLTLSSQEYPEPGTWWARTSASASTWVYPEKDCDLAIEVSMEAGRSWSLNVHEDLPEELPEMILVSRWFMAVAILLMVGFGVVHLLPYVRGSDMTTARRDQQHPEERRHIESYG